MIKKAITISDIAVDGYLSHRIPEYSGNVPPVIRMAARKAVERIASSCQIPYPDITTKDGQSFMSDGNWVVEWQEQANRKTVVAFHKLNDWLSSQELEKIAKKSLGWSYITIPKNIQNTMKKIRDKIDPEDIGEDGKENDPHITCKYGLTVTDPEEVKAAVAGNRGGKVRMGKTSLFQNDDADVLKVSVTSHALHSLWKSLSTLDNEDKYDEYRPHATLAYLKPGTGKKYSCIDLIDGMEFSFDEFMFQDAKDVETKIKLDGINPITKAAQSEMVLDAKAIDNNGQTFKATLTWEESKLRSEPGIVPMITFQEISGHTFGKWKYFLSSLLDHGDGLMIDMGQKWFLKGIKAIVAEAKSIVEAKKEAEREIERKKLEVIPDYNNFSINFTDDGQQILNGPDEDLIFATSRKPIKIAQFDDNDDENFNLDLQWNYQNRTVPFVSVPLPVPEEAARPDEVFQLYTLSNRVWIHTETFPNINDLLMHISSMTANSEKLTDINVIATSETNSRRIELFMIQKLSPSFAWGHPQNGRQVVFDDLQEALSCLNGPDYHANGSYRIFSNVRGQIEEPLVRQPTDNAENNATFQLLRRSGNNWDRIGRFNSITSLIQSISSLMEVQQYDIGDFRVTRLSNGASTGTEEEIELFMIKKQVPGQDEYEHPRNGRRIMFDDLEEAAWALRNPEYAPENGNFRIFSNLTGIVDNHQETQVANDPSEYGPSLQPPLLSPGKLRFNSLYLIQFNAEMFGGETAIAKFMGSRNGHALFDFGHGTSTVVADNTVESLRSVPTAIPIFLIEENMGTEENPVWSRNEFSRDASGGGTEPMIFDSQEQGEEFLDEYINNDRFEEGHSSDRSHYRVVDINAATENQPADNSASMYMIQIDSHNGWNYWGDRDGSTTFASMEEAATELENIINATGRSRQQFRIVPCRFTIEVNFSGQGFEDGGFQDANGDAQTFSNQEEAMNTIREYREEHPDTASYEFRVMPQDSYRPGPIIGEIELLEGHSYNIAYNEWVSEEMQQLQGFAGRGVYVGDNGRSYSFADPSNLRETFSVPHNAIRYVSRTLPNDARIANTDFLIKIS